jgi:hypothetical protein
VKPLAVISAMVACLAVLIAGMQADARDDRWLTYRNARWGFRIERPSGWAVDQGGDGAGILLTRNGQGVAVGAGYRLEEGSAQSTPPACSKTGDIDPLVARGSDRAADQPRNVVSRPIRFRGQPACFERWTFTMQGAAYLGEYVTLPTRGLEYHFSLECRASECPAVRRVYQRVVASLQFSRDE